MPDRQRYEYLEDEEVYECDLCGMKFDDESEIEEHMQTDHTTGL